MSMFTRSAPRKSFSDLPVGIVGENIMSYLPPMERARLAISTGSFLPVSHGYFGRGYSQPADVTRPPTDSDILSASRSQMHREYMSDMKSEDEDTFCIEREKNLIPEKYIADKIYNPDESDLGYYREDINYDYVFPAIAQYGLICTLKKLVRQGRINLRNEGNYFLSVAIHDVKYAFQNNRLSKAVDVIKFLLENGVNPNTTFPGGVFPILDSVVDSIEYSTRDGMNRPTAVDFRLNIEIIKLLLKYGANPTVRRQELMRATIARLAHYINPRMIWTPPSTPIDVMVTITEGPFAELQQKDPELYQFFVEVRSLFEESIRNRTQSYGLSKRKTSKRKASKRKASKRKTSKRKTSKRKTSKRKASKRKASKRKASKRRATKRR